MQAMILTQTNWFGSHTLETDCRVPVDGEKHESSWIMGTRREEVLPQGTVITMEHATSEYVFALLDGRGIAIPKSAIPGLRVTEPRGTQE